MIDRQLGFVAGSLHSGPGLLVYHTSGEAPVLSTTVSLHLFLESPVVEITCSFWGIGWCNRSNHGIPLTRQSRLTRLDAWVFPIP